MGTGIGLPQRLRRGLLGLLLVVAVMVGVPATAWASPLPTTASWTAAGNGRWTSWKSYDRDGDGYASAGDVDGDGYDDVIVGAPPPFFSDPSPRTGNVYRGSPAGLATSPTWSVPGVGTTAGDVDSDGYDDLILADGVSPTVKIVFGSASGPDLARPSVTLQTDQPAEFGYSFSSAGDVNEDGYDDVIVGAPLYTTPAGAEGRAYLYLGGLEPSGTPVWTGWVNGQLNFGRSVSGAGDVDQDGKADVIVGARGSVFVYLGNGSPPYLPAEPDWHQIGLWNHDLGSAVDGAGDVDGDGFDDVIVGDRMWDDGQYYEGAAFLYRGFDDGLNTTPAWTVEGNSSTTYLGRSVAGAGDVNADGYDDVIVGVIGSGWGAHLYLGSASGLSTTPAWRAADDQGYSYYGIQVGSAGDVNGDCASDVIAGAFFYDNPDGTEGRAFVYHGVAQHGTITGVVRADGVPLPNVPVWVRYEAGGYDRRITDGAGAYLFENAWTGAAEVFIVAPLGYVVVSPPGGTAMVTVAGGCRDVTTLDFDLESIPASACGAQFWPWWKQQAIWLINGTGSPTVDFYDLEYHYPEAIWNHFYINPINPIRIDGVTHSDGSPMNLYTIDATFSTTPPVLAIRQFLALMLNVAANCLRPTDVVGVDASGVAPVTLSEAIQHIEYLIETGTTTNYTKANIIATMIIAGTPLGSGPNGVPSGPVIAYARRPGQTGIVGSLAQVRPNPMDKGSTIEFQVQREGRVRVVVYDPSGRRVRTLLDGALERGRQRVEWDGRGADGRPVPNGVYFYRIEMPDRILRSESVVMRR